MASEERYLPSTLRYPSRLEADAIIDNCLARILALPLTRRINGIRFESAYEIFLRLRGTCDFAAAAKGVSVFGIPPNRSVLAKAIQLLFQAAGAAQRKSIASDPALAAVNSRLIDLVSAGLLVTDSALLRQAATEEMRATRS